MRTQPEPLTRRFKGWVVEYANDSRYKGLAGYLQVINWQQRTVTSTSHVEEATIFEQRDEACKWAEEYSLLMGTGHHVPEAIPIWQISTLTLNNPNREEVTANFMFRVKELVESNHA